jgi:hypothetical protein
MNNIRQAHSVINKAKKKLIDKAAKQGLTENFGEAEVRKLLDQCDPYGAPEQRVIHSMVQEFENWTMNYTG